MLGFYLLHMSCFGHGLHGVWYLFQRWTLAHWVTHSYRCVTQDPRVGSSEAHAIHPTHLVCLVACTSEAHCETEKKKNFQVFSSIRGCIFSACLWVLSLNFAVLQMCVCVCVCVCGAWTRVYTQSSLSVFTMLGTTVLSLLALWCGCSFVKLTYLHQTPSWLWLVWTNSPTLCN